MSVTGLCQICEAAEARFACERCGAVVCADHYDADLGYCQRCATEVRGGTRDRSDTGDGGDSDGNGDGNGDGDDGFAGPR